MNVSCPECETTYRVDPRKIPSTGVIARCARCPGELSIPAVTGDQTLAPAVPSDPTVTGTAAEDGDSSRQGGRTEHGTDAHPSASGAERGSFTTERETNRPEPHRMEGLGDAADPGPVHETTRAPAKADLEQTAFSPANDTWDEAFGYGREGIASQSSEPGPPSDPDSARSATFDDHPTRMDPSAPTDEAASPTSAPLPQRDEEPSRSGGDLTREEPPTDQHAARRAMTLGEEAPPAGEPLAPTRSNVEPDLPPPPFGFTDPHSRARRLARALVSDIVVYHPDRRERSLREGTLRQEFREEIRKSWDEYVANVGEQIARDTTYFRDALNELLAGGARFF